MSGEVDPFRADAVVVYRSLRDGGAATASELAARCFPLPEGEMPHTTQVALTKRAYRRVIDSIVWLRHQPGMVIHAYPGLPTEEDSGRGTTGTLFSLVPVPERLMISPIRSPQRVHRESTTPLAPIRAPVTDEVSQEGDDPWHVGR